MPKEACVHSGRVWARIETLSPGSRPRSTRPSETSRTVPPSSAYATSFHSPPSLTRWADWSAKRSAASGSRSAIVFEPVACPAAVVASIWVSPLGPVEEGGFYGEARVWLRLGELLLLLRVLETAIEEGL